ncbi:MAG: DUF2079 domain-containing protein [Cyanobacteria bacterium MAG CAR3_bin_5]|nr:DUF2079 domain-containing protein [Cyanobacteria bacterium MAG CAR3_bin_5]
MKSPATVRFQGPPRLFWLVSALLVALFWGLAALKHALLQSSGFDLGIYDQVAWQMSQGLEPRSTLLGLHHMGNHGAWMFYAIAPLYWLAPSVHWLFFTQALGLIITAWPLWHLGAQAGLKPRERWLICGLWWLQPVAFNVNLFDFHPETWAMPFLALAIWANRAERRWLWRMALFAAMGCRDGLTLIVMGLALEQILRRRWRWGAEALLSGGGWLLLLAAGLYSILNNGGGVAAVIRYNHLCEGGCEGVGHIIRSVLLDPIHLFGALDWASILFYLFLVSLPLAFYWRRSSLPLLAATLPLLAVNILSSLSSQQDLIHQYNLPIAILLVVASMDGLAADLRQGRLWLTQRLWFCCFWASLCFVVLVNRGHILGYHLVSRFDDVQPVETMIRFLPTGDRAKHDHVPSLNELSQAQDLIHRIPADAAVLTHNNLAPHVSHRPVVKLLSADAHPLSDFAEFDVAFLDRKNPWYGLSHSATAPQHTAATIERLKNLGWTCDEKGRFALCQRPE